MVEGVKMFLEAQEEEMKKYMLWKAFRMRPVWRSWPGRPFETVSEEVFRKMSDTAAPQGTCA